jgi:hypothetical protein
LQPSFFSADDYCKRLLGNGFSIPTVEILLRPLVDLFGSKVYTNYNYGEQPGSKDADASTGRKETQSSLEFCRKFIEQ